MAKSPRMPKKTSVWFTARQAAYVNAYAKEWGIDFAKAVRQIINERIEREKWRGPDGGQSEGKQAG